MNYIFYIIWAGWFLSEIFMARFCCSEETGTARRDKHSLLLIWITIVLSILLGVFCAIQFPCLIAPAAMVNYSGLVIIIAGIMVRLTAIRTLGKFFTVDLAVQPDHKLVDRGLYKHIRHPSYTGSLLSFLGMGISLNNLISVGIIFIPILVSFIYRTNIEEKMLLERFGPVYREYMKRTKRFLPYIY